MADLTPAQAAQQDNRNGAGRYAEKGQADPGPSVIPGVPDSIRHWNTAAEWGELATEAKATAEMAAKEHQTAMVAGLCAQVIETYPDARWLNASWKWDGYRNNLALTNVYNTHMRHLGQIPGDEVLLNVRPGPNEAAWQAAFEGRSTRIDVIKMMEIAAGRPPVPARTHQ